MKKLIVFFIMFFIVISLFAEIKSINKLPYCKKANVVLLLKQPKNIVVNATNAIKETENIYGCKSLNQITIFEFIFKNNKYVMLHMTEFYASEKMAILGLKEAKRSYTYNNTKIFKDTQKEFVGAIGNYFFILNVKRNILFGIITTTDMIVKKN